MSVAASRPDVSRLAGRALARDTSAPLPSIENLTVEAIGGARRDRLAGDR